MISRKLIAALVGLTLVAGTAAEASATIANTQTGTKPVASKTIATTSSATKSAGVVKAPSRRIATKHHRLHVSHRVVKRMKMVKANVGKRIALSRHAKRVVATHA